MDRRPEAVDPALRARHEALRARIAELLHAAKGDQSSWIIPPLRVNFDERLFARLRRRGMHGPLWQHLVPLALQRSA